MWRDLLLDQSHLFALLQYVNVNCSQGNEAIDVHSLLLTVSLCSPNALCHRGIIQLLRRSEERGRKDDVVHVGEIAARDMLAGAVTQLDVITYIPDAVSLAGFSSRTFFLLFPRLSWKSFIILDI